MRGERQMTAVISIKPNPSAMTPGTSEAKVEK